jgi:hypothetical protein
VRDATTDKRLMRTQTPERLRELTRQLNPSSQ